ncbi:MAG: P-II family nitrogen regulator [Acidobacteriota bacterium]
MKLITAIIRPDKLNDVLEGLFEIDVHGLTITRCLGHGGELESVETYRGMTVKMELTEKVKIEIGVSDPFVEKTVDAIVQSGRTGAVGDGKVFVTPVSDVVRIRTGERNQDAVTPTSYPVSAAF